MRYDRVMALMAVYLRVQLTLWPIFVICSLLPVNLFSLPDSPAPLLPIFAVPAHIGFAENDCSIRRILCEE